MLIIAFKFYKLDLIITFIYLSFELINFIIYPIYNIKTCYLQLQESAKKITTNKIISGIIRVILSFLKTPYCTGIGQVSSAIYQLVTVNIMFNNNKKEIKQ